MDQKESNNFLNLRKNLVVNFYCIGSIMKIHIIGCVPGQILSRKNLVLDISIKILPANQIAGFLKQPFLQNNSMKQPHFLHVDTNSQK